jgi:charged multivesicular body protein 7
MGASTKVLKSLNKRTGGVERVEDVVEELREEMTKVDEVGQIIGEVGKVNTAAEEDEVEDELEALEREEKEKEKAKEEAKRVAETRRRLAEIDKVREPSRQEEPQNVAVAEKLDEQVNALRGLSLEENSPLEKRRLQELEKSERGKLSAD